MDKRYHNSIMYCVAMPQYMFNTYCKIHDIDDSNVDNFTDYAFISIIDWNEDTHYFKNNHENVLNLEFADVGENGPHCITPEQIEQIEKFIDRNVGKNFLVHCIAGQSRSQAVVSYIRKFYSAYIQYRFEISGNALYMYQVNEMRVMLTPNHYVLAELSRKKMEEQLNSAFNEQQHI